VAGLFSEVRRRKVLQGAAAYAVAGWLLIQVAVTLKGSLDLPERVDSWVTIAVIAGFPVAIVLAWLFDFSLAGIKLTRPEVSDALPEKLPTVAVARVPAPKHSIAVLSFSDMSAERDQAYLGDGVAENGCAQLAEPEGFEPSIRLFNRITV
jgi:hypothetical protein